MKKFLLFAFAAVMLGFAGCNDDENKDNIPPTLREYEAPVFMYGKTREEVKASVPYAYSGASETSLYFEGKGIVKEYIYIFEDDKVYSCGSILSDLYIDDLHTLLYADNYDEDAIHAELAKLKLDMYAAAVFDAMTEKTGLTEGFMPLPARKGRKSRQILKYIK